MCVFLDRNTRARLYLRDACRENCYRIKEGGWKYIGIQEGFLEKYRDRLVYVSGDLEITKGVWLIPHRDIRAGACRTKRKDVSERGWKMITDCFAHEQSLVFDTPEGLVIFNSCSHGGADTVICETKKVFPGRKVRALIGGFHLHNKTEQYVREISARIRKPEWRRYSQDTAPGKKHFMS